MVGWFRGIGIRRVMGKHGDPWLIQKYRLGVNVVLGDKVQPSFWKSDSESTRSMIRVEWALRSTSEVWKDTQAPGSALIGIKHDGSVNGIFYFNGRSQTFASCVRSHNLSLGITLLQALELRHQTTSTKDEEVVLCPLSLTDGWVSEINRFTPKLEALRYVGDKDFRRALRKSKHGHVNKSSKLTQLEKAMWELRSENSEIKFTAADSKLTEVLVRSVEEKNLEVEAKLRAVDARLAEVSKKSSELERK